MATLQNGRTEFVKKAFYERFNPEEEYLGTNKPVNNIEPLVSVLVSTYQHEEFISECLDSILEQKTDFPFEILVGEDESRDKTRAICKTYAEQHPDKIRLFLRDRKTSQLYDENGNYLCRFNGKWLGLSMRGKYIASCEGDDYWIDENKLQKQINFLQANPDFSMCFHNAKIICTHRPEAFTFTKIKEGEYTGLDLYKDWVVPSASVVFSPDFIENKDIFLNSNFLFGDILLFLELAEAGRVWYFDELMSVYRRHEGNMTNTSFFENPENVKKYIIQQKQILQSFPDTYKKTAYKKISQYYFILFKQTAKKDFTSSLDSLIKSFYYSPSKNIQHIRKFLQARMKVN